MDHLSIVRGATHVRRAQLENFVTKNVIIIRYDDEFKINSLRDSRFLFFVLSVVRRRRVFVKFQERYLWLYEKKKAEQSFFFFSNKNKIILFFRVQRCLALFGFRVDSSPRYTLYTARHVCRIRRGRTIASPLINRRGRTACDLRPSSPAALPPKRCPLPPPRHRSPSAAFYGSITRNHNTRTTPPAVSSAAVLVAALGSSSSLWPDVRRSNVTGNTRLRV